MNIFKILLALPDSAVYALVNESDRRVYITYSMALKQSLMKLIADIKSGSGEWSQLCTDINKLEFVIVETDNCRNRLMTRVNYWNAEYKAKGYALYKENEYVRYRIRKEFKTMNNRSFVYVYLVSKRNSKILVGKFETDGKADEFINKSYTNGIVNDIIYDKSVSGDLRV